MRPTVKVTISPEGNIEVEAQGMKGKGCEALTEAFEKGLGSVTEDRKKPEYHAHEQQPKQQRAGQ